MSYPFDAFLVLAAGVLTMLSLVAGGVAIAASVLYRSFSLRKEILTRRVQGARRSQIVRMLLADNVIGVAAGVLCGVAVLIVVEQHRPHVVGGLILSVAAVAIIGLCGGWLAGWHAVRRTDFGQARTLLNSVDRE